jgi:GDPmannose 4,6-dehydratase
MENNKKIAIVTGINGQDGSYLAEFLLKKGYHVIGLRRRSSSNNNDRIKHLFNNENNKNLELHYYDLSDGSTLTSLIAKYKPDEFYNLGGQSDVSISFAVPEYTSDVIGNSVLKILGAIRTLSPNTRFYQASSSEMYGSSKDYGENGYTELSRMMPVSPYAVSKLYAHHMVKVYRDAYNIHASSGILFNHESPRRGENFVTKKITMGAAKIKLGLENKLILGNLDAYRDWGYAGDYVKAMWLMLQQDSGDDYVISTGKTHSVREFLKHVFEYAGLGDYNKYVEYDQKYTRPNEVPYLLGDSSKAKKKLGWKPEIGVIELAHMMYDFDFLSINTSKDVVYA